MRTLVVLALLACGGPRESPASIPPPGECMPQPVASDGGPTCFEVNCQAVPDPICGACRHYTADNSSGDGPCP